MTTPFIVNPAAGGGRASQALPTVLARIEAGGRKVKVYPTTGPGVATELALRLAEEGHEELLCGGGDGTTWEVLNGIMQATRRPALCSIPLGTGNSFLRDLGVFSADDAVTAWLASRTRTVDVVQADCDEGRFWFINLLSLGFVSEVGAMTNRWFKPLGQHGYTLATILQVARLRHHVFPMRLDGGPTEADPCVFYSFNNSRCTGGTMQMAPSANPSDGVLDIIRVGPMGALTLLGTFPKIYEGRHLEHPLCSAQTAAKVDFDLSGPVPIMVDGEVIERRLRSLTVLPGALTWLA
jgi:YegS/Rv2252/BmrU family lipid kinase